MASLFIAILVVAVVPPAAASTSQVGPIVADIASLPFAQPNSCQGETRSLGLAREDVVPRPVPTDPVVVGLVDHGAKYCDELQR